MKTLKKTLCLVLAVIMVVGVLILPASATDYADDAKITHKEAVDVLTGLKVLEGDDSGFRPDDTLNRAEAAAVISRMLQTRAVADKFSSTNTGFTDCEDPDVSWAKRYIAYCVNQGIIAGTEKGFEPAREVTGHEFAKMILCALGFDAAENGFYGDQWDVNVEITARKEGLVDNLGDDFDFTAPITRDDVAQMTFDALQYSTSSLYTGRYQLFIIGNSEFENNQTLRNLNYQIFDSRTEALLVVNAAFEGEENKPVLGTDYTLVAETDLTDSIMDTTYNGYDYVNTTDAFKRPIKVWSDRDGKNEVVIVTEPIAKFKGGISSASLYVSLARKKTAYVTLYVDGKYDNTSMPLIENNDYTHAVGGSGSEVYVYLTGADSYRICVINTYAGTITGHTPATLDANGNVTVKENVTVGSLGTGVGTLAGPFNTTAFTDLDAIVGTTVYYTAAYTNHDNYALQSVDAAQSFVGTMTSFNVGTNSYVINGTNYARNYKAPDIAGARGVPTTFYTDSQGFIINQIPVVDQTNYAVLTRFVLVRPATSGAIGSEAANYLQAELVMFDGTVQVVTVGRITVGSTTYTATGVPGTTLLSDASLIQGAVENKVVTFGVDGENVYTLAVPAQAVTATGATIKATNNFDGTNIANSQTKFVIRTGTPGRYAYRVVTGYASLPVGLIDNVTVTGVKNGNIASFVYLYGSDGTSLAAQNRVVFITGSPTYQVVNNGALDYYEYPVVENGAVGTIKVANSAVNAATLFTGTPADKFYTITQIDSATGYVTEIAKTADSDDTANDGFQVTAITAPAANEIITFTEGVKDYNASTVVYVITGNTVATADIATLRAGWTVYVTYAKVNGVETNLITAIVAVNG